MKPNWTLIKVLGAHLYGDFSCQSLYMAQNKNTCAFTRARHVALVATSFGAALATDDKLSIKQKATVIAINTVTHFVIDSFKLNKWIDQALHVLVALGSVKL